ncbi:MAG: alpha-1,4 polygalactosaminidase [Cyclobacteriaceae bacterium]|nr:alpha-1,4 polygalactosaminidase [Cyclobacteriaceae bacterium]
MAVDNTEQITMAEPQDNNRWLPSVGIETQSLLAHLQLPRESEGRLIDETVDILSKCGNPNNETNSEIGLVFGYVQSGKTMSFTTLTALAKDNSYQMVIIIAGISTNLVAQSYTRLERDLRIDTRTDLQWLSFRNPRLNDITTRNQIATALSEYKDDTFPGEERKTILITVMKQRNHLPNLQELLQTLDLKRVPTLIIDDEGDQHSMNRFARQNARQGGNRRSAINDRIINLRNSIPHHTFIQYTATPQAPLFIDLMDSLSPNFIKLLTPGPAYTGGREFFVEQPESTEVIPDVDPEEDPASPPASLISAMQVFFLGVVKGMRSREGRKRSMMIHPSQLTYTHADYFRFVTNIKNHFVEVLSLPDDNPDKQDLLSEFRAAYNDLARTATDIPQFEELTGHRLRHAINSTVVQSLNSRGGNRTIVEWRNNYSFILIGGQAMDRGFTVEGLTVTYMPRSVGVGNADTIQQRARFFGYKQSYLGYCRVYLDQDARDTYIKYVEHEEDMRRRLAEHEASGRSLNEWYREVFLSSDLNLARTNIFSNEFERTITGGEWNVIKIPHYSQQIVSSNQDAASTFIANAQFDRTGRIPTLRTSLSSVYDELLNLLRFTSPADVGDYTAILYALSRHLEEVPDETCTVFLMSNFENPRERTLNPENNQINQLFQGRSSNYEGDRAILDNGITFQIHILNLLQEDRIVFSNVPAIATHIPIELGREFIRWA